MRIVIVGGSVAGCAAAVELGGAGHRATVHERAPEELSGRGIGIGTDRRTMARLIDRGLIEPDTPRVDNEVVRYVHRAPDGGSRRVGDVVLPLTALRWSDLHRGLRARVPDDAYVPGDDVSAASVTRDRGADLAVFADGYLSAGRGLMEPAAQPRYRGLVLWRGLVPEREIDATAIDGAMTRIVYPGGHGVAYPIPGDDGERLLMWAFYLAVPERELDAVLTDRGGHRHGGSVPFGRTADEVAATLRARLAGAVPDAYLDLIDRSGAETSLQAIFTVDVERSHRGRSCLIGDAARVFPPFSMSGVLKAVDDAVSLRESLDAAACGDLDTALTAWGDAQRATAERIRRVAERTERALVHEVPDLDAMSRDDAGRWLGALHEGATVRLP